MPTNNRIETAVVILCWNGRKFLEEFLPSVIENNSEGYEIFIADNASTDDSAVFVKERFPGVCLLQLERNYGFAEGYNQAIARIDANYIVLLNQDVMVSSNWLAPMLSLLGRDQHIGAIQPRIRSYQQRGNFEYAGAAGGWIDRYGYAFCRGRIFDTLESDHNQFNTHEEIFWASGACMVVRKNVFESMGGFDADFFAHMEEIDFCWRLKNAGYSNWYCADSTVFHLGGGSLPQGNPFKTYLNFRNNLMMISKNLNDRRMMTLLIRIGLDQIAAIRMLVLLKFKDFLAVQRAQLHFLFHMRIFNRKREVKSTPFLSMKGVYNGSVAWDYFVKKKKTFSDIIN